MCGRPPRSNGMQESNKQTLLDSSLSATLSSYYAIVRGPLLEQIFLSEFLWARKEEVKSSS